MSAPDIPDPQPPPVVIPPESDVRNIDAARQRRLRGATLIAGRGAAANTQTLGASLIGGLTGRPT